MDTLDAVVLIVLAWYSCMSAPSSLADNKLASLPRGFAVIPSLHSVYVAPWCELSMKDSTNGSDLTNNPPMNTSAFLFAGSSIKTIK